MEGELGETFTLWESPRSSTAFRWHLVGLLSHIRTTAQHSEAVEVMTWEMTFHEFELVSGGFLLIASFIIFYYALLFDSLSNACLAKDPSIYYI